LHNPIQIQISKWIDNPIRIQLQSNYFLEKRYRTAIIEWPSFVMKPWNSQDISVIDLQPYWLINCLKILIKSSIASLLENFALRNLNFLINNSDILDLDWNDKTGLLIQIQNLILTLDCQSQSNQPNWIPIQIEQSSKIQKFFFTKIKLVIKR